MSMIEVKTAELIGDLLDCLIATIENPAEKVFFNADGYTNRWHNKPPKFSTDWAVGGPLIEKYAVKIEHFPGETIASKANARVAMNRTAYWQSGPTPLVALCRAIVAAKLGEVVSVPAELVQQQGEGGGKV